jgi:hypothetical protein
MMEDSGVRQLTDDDRHDDKHSKVDEVNRIVDAEIVDGRIEKEGRRTDPCRSRYHCGNDAAAESGQQHRDEVDDGNGFEFDETRYRSQHGSKQNDKQQRKADYGERGLQRRATAVGLPSR